MANSKYEYVKSMERRVVAEEGFMVVRLDGRGFTGFCSAHELEKPSDDRALHLMNAAAVAVVEEFGEIVLAYGVSDEYSFVFKADASLYSRREDKITSTLVSLFTAAYVMKWPEFMVGTPLRRPPVFDGRLVVYPDERAARDYLSWRQVDAHVNNQYNYAFWALVKGGVSRTDAAARLAGTDREEKEEAIRGHGGVEYADLPPMHRKGSVVVREMTMEDHETPDGKPYRRPVARVAVVHEDLIGDDFWERRPNTLVPLSRYKRRKQLQKGDQQQQQQQQQP